MSLFIRPRHSVALFCSLFCMDMNNIMQLIMSFVILEKHLEVSSMTINTEDVVTDLQEDNRIILNCTYQNASREKISDRYIRWKKQINNSFTDIAFFSPPNGFAPLFIGEIGNLYKNRTELIDPNASGTLSAVMIINDLLCMDAGKYKCWIQYFDGNSEKDIAESSEVAFNTRATKPKEFCVTPTEIEENESITIHCAADVGSPNGYIQIWKTNKKSNTSEVIYKSNTTFSKTENCTEIINATSTYKVTRKDNGAIFRCTSQNNFTKDVMPSSDSSTISVFYGPDKPVITVTPNKTVYTAGDSLTIRCSSDSNPPPLFTWIFKPQNKSGDNRIEYSDDRSKLVFSSLKTEDSGIYICAVNISARQSFPNTSFLISVLDKISKEKYSDCSQCGYIETCMEKNKKTVCIFNFWVPVAVVFIVLSALFAVSSFVLVNQRKKSQENSSTDNTLIENRCLPSNEQSEKIHGDYISPEDLEFGSLQPSEPQKESSRAYTRL